MAAKRPSRRNEPDATPGVSAARSGGPESADRWWARSGSDVLLELGSARHGLSRADAIERLRAHGPNRIETSERARWWRMLLHQFASPLIYVLIAALLVTLFIQHWADAIVIGFVLVLNATVGLFQEYRAENAMQALLGLVAPRATVRRDGDRFEIASEELVPGDVVYIESGDIVPADVRLLDTVALQIDEAVITGESMPVDKDADLQFDDVPLPELRNMAFMGTTVATGRGMAAVVATGSRSRMGAIAEEMRQTQRAATPLQQRMQRFAGRLALAVVLASVIAFAIGLWRGEPLSAMFLTAVAIAVSAMPEGLPVVMTIALAVSVRRMARRRAIIRRLPAVETLGSCTVIVTDKTGTLTENRMTASTIWSAGRTYRVLGGSLTGEGWLEHDGERVTVAPESEVWRTLLAGLLDNEGDLRLEPASGELRGVGDPTDIALLVAARKAGLDREQLLDAFPTIDDIPFESERCFSATVHRHDADDLVFLKGAPERVVAMCDTWLSDSGPEPIDRAAVLDAAAAFAGQGLRMLAMAEGRGPTAVAAVHRDPRGMMLLGLIGLVDPPRDGVEEALAKCRAAGIHVIMVTGDHASTAAAVASEIGLAPPSLESSSVSSGSDIAALSDAELTSRLRDDVVFARIAPDQKLRIVNVLRDAGEVVAVTGDGVNDAPALKAAHIGAAMGRTGTDVAREAGEIVLADDDFATVFAAVEEGRVAFANIRNASFFLISSGVADLLTILASLAFGLPLPFLPAQILWLNVVTNGIQDVALAMEPGEPHLIQQPPRPLREGVLSRVLVERTILEGLAMAGCTLALFMWELRSGAELAYAQVAAVTAMVVFQVVHVGNCRSETVSVFRRSVFSNPFLLIGSALALGLHVLAMTMPWTQYLLRLQPLTAETWLTIAVMATSVIVVAESHKLLWRRRVDAGRGAA